MKSRFLIAILSVAIITIVTAGIALNTGSASAATACTFTTAGTTMTLDGDCTTDATILVPDGFTLDGKNHTITAVDPSAGHFVGAVVQNAGSTANVTNLNVTVSGLSNVCDGGADRLRGIMFEGASGSITHNSIIGINQGASGCQEGNAIEVRNAPFDGTHPATKTVEVSFNMIDDFQKTGIVANGDVDVTIKNNRIGDSATQANLAANSIQVGFGAIGVVRFNNVEGNQWLGASNFAATAILVFLADDVVVSNNNISGNSDVGVFASSTNDGTYNNNRVFDIGVDGPHGDFGIVDVSGTGNVFTNNKIRGFDTPLFGIDEGSNKVIPNPVP